MRPEDRKIIITARAICYGYYMAMEREETALCLCVCVCGGCQHNIFNFVYILHFYCGVALCRRRCLLPAAACAAFVAFNQLRRVGKWEEVEEEWEREQRKSSQGSRE